MPFPTQTLIAADGQFNEQVIKIRSIDDTAKAAKMARYLLYRLRLNLVITLSSGARSRCLDPEDLVSYSHRVPGWSGKMLRIQAPVLQPDGTVVHTCCEDYPDLYNDDVTVPYEHSYHDTNLPDPTASVPSVTGITHGQEVYLYRDRSFTRWDIGFTPPAPQVYPWWKEAEIWLKVGAGDWTPQTTSVSGFTVDPVQEGVTYACKIVSCSIFGTKQDFDSAPVVSDYITGKTALPSDLGAVTGTSSGDTVSLIAEVLSDGDIKGYECRIGSSFAGGLFFDFRSAPTFRMSGVKPGQFTFWIAAMDNGGHYAANPKSAVVGVNYPSGYSDKNTWSWDFSAGVLTNVEVTTFGGNSVLKCSHAGGVLTGTWQSPVYDLGSIKTVRTWGDFIGDFAASGLTWDGLIPAPNTWDSLGVATRTWADIFSAVAAGKIEATIEWGVTPGVYVGRADYFQILAPEFQARYVRVTVTITDPTLDSNTYLRTLNMKAAYWE